MEQTFEDKVAAMSADFSKQLTESQAQIQTISNKIEQLKGALYAVGQIQQLFGRKDENKE